MQTMSDVLESIFAEYPGCSSASYYECCSSNDKYHDGGVVDMDAARKALLSGDFVVRCTASEPHTLCLDAVAPDLMCGYLQSGDQRHTLTLHNVDSAVVLGQGGYGLVIQARLRPGGVVDGRRPYKNLSSSSSSSSSGGGASGSVKYRKGSSPTDSDRTPPAISLASLAGEDWTAEDPLLPLNLAEEGEMPESWQQKRGLTRDASIGVDSDESLGTRTEEEGELVAVKLLEMQAGEPIGTEGVRNFVREIWIMNSLRHPNIVQLRGVCLVPRLAIVLEFVPGGNLFDEMEDPFGVKRAMLTFATALEGFLYCPGEIRSETTSSHDRRHIISSAPMKGKGVQSARGDILEDARSSNSGMRAATTPNMPKLKQDGSMDLSQPVHARFRAAFSTHLEELERCFRCMQVHGAFDGAEKERKKETMSEEAIERVLQLVEDELLGIFVVQDRRQFLHFHSKFVDKVMEQIFQCKFHVLSDNNLWLLRLKVSTDIARGMQYLHAVKPPVVHSDLKSDNVFLTCSLLEYMLRIERGTVDWTMPFAKVGDFGLSAHLLGETVQEKSGESVGSAPRSDLNPRWRSPEVLCGDKYTLCSDVYAMGIVLWEVFAMKVPFGELQHWMSDIQDAVLEGKRPAFAYNGGHGTHMNSIFTCVSATILRLIVSLLKYYQPSKY